MMAGHEQHHKAPCSQNCPYRRLYEGAQLSLTDMAARQAEALTRLSRVRNGVMQAIRHSDPERFTQVELQLGKRLMDVDDDTVIEVLNAWTARPPENRRHSVDQNLGSALGALRSVLVDMGITLPPGTDPAQWASALREQQRSSPQGRGRVSALETVDTLGDLFGDEEFQTPAQDSQTLGDLFPDETPEAPTAETQTTAVEPDYRRPGTTRPDDIQQGDASGEKKAGRGRKPAAARPHPGEVPGGVQASQSFPVPSAPLPEAEPDSPFDDSPFDDSPFDDSPFDATLGDVSQPDEAALITSADNVDPTDDDFGSLDFGLDDGNTAGGGTAGGGTVGGGTADGPASNTTTGSGGDTPTTNNTPSFGSGDNLAPERPQGNPYEPDRGRTESIAPTPPVAVAPAAPLRPNLTGAGKKRTGGKAARVSATRPGLDAGGDLPDETPPPDGVVADALLAAVSVPRPVFLDDLRSVAKDPAILDAWQKEMLGSGTSPIRFIPAKSRHRALGPLVIPRDFLKEVAANNGGWWHECVSRYRGNRLFELGVLLRRVGAHIVSHKIGEHTLTVRLNDARGLSGMVVVLDPELGEGAAAREEVVSALDELLRERLTLIAVLATNDTAIAPLEELLRDEAVARRWQPTMPVALSRSWHWGEGSASADVILGG
jgi:hypothetical protein